MKNPKRYPEIFVEKDWLVSRGDIIKRVVKIDDNTYRVIYTNPVFGDTMEIFEVDGDGDLCLKSIFTPEMQTEEELESVKDYYNNYILDGEQTYIEYFNKAVGYFLLSRNIGVYPTSVYDEQGEE
jgi:hypothetical protein